MSGDYEYFICEDTGKFISKSLYNETTLRILGRMRFNIDEKNDGHLIVTTANGRQVFVFKNNEWTVLKHEVTKKRMRDAMIDISSLHGCLSETLHVPLTVLQDSIVETLVKYYT